MDIEETHSEMQKYAIPNRFGKYVIYTEGEDDPTEESGSLHDILKRAEKLAETHYLEIWGDDILATGEPGLGITPYGPR